MNNLAAAFTHRNLPRLLLQARESVIAHFRPILKAHGLTEQQWRVLRALVDAGPLEPLIEELSQLVDISPRDIRRFQRLREDDRRQEAVPIRTQLDDAEVARFMAQRFRFPGVDVSARLFRQAL